MKVYFEGTVDEIRQLLFCDCDEDETVCDECKCGCEMSPAEKLKLNLINAFANTIDVLLNSKA